MKHADQFLAAIVELSTSWFINGRYFQGAGIPATTLCYFANDLMRSLKRGQDPQSPSEKFNLWKESVIAWKQLRGSPLTQDEAQYDHTLHEIDVMGEILNGVHYAALFALGENLVSTLTSAARNGLWSHVPAIVGYTSAAILGPQLVASAIEGVLSKANIDEKQMEEGAKIYTQ